MTKLFEQLEELGLFKWLDEEHNLANNRDITPEHMGKLSINDIHRTVMNACAFRFFREKYGYHSYIDSFVLTTKEFIYDYVISGDDIEPGDDGRTWKTPEEAEFNCLIALIELVKNK